MAQMRPKFKVNGYKLFRKSYVLAVIQKLKPFINERYAQYLLEESKKVDTPDNADVPQNGALLQNQMEKTDNFIATTVDPFKPFWQGRKGHVPSPNLSTLGGETNWDTALSDSSSDSSGCSNQVAEQNSNGSKDKEVVYPTWYRASDLLVSNLSDSILDFLSPYEDDLPLAQYVVVRPAPRIGRRTEIDLTTIDRLLSRPIYLKYLTAKVISNRNESTSTIDLSDQMHLKDIDPGEQQLQDSWDS
ncbi:hypothetical protein ACLKA7_006497 [Drosophila subpalustris]